MDKSKKPCSCCQKQPEVYVPQVVGHVGPLYTWKNHWHMLQQPEQTTKASSLTEEVSSVVLKSGMRTPHPPPPSASALRKSLCAISPLSAQCGGAQARAIKNHVPFEKLRMWNTFSGFSSWNVQTELYLQPLTHKRCINHVLRMLFGNRVFTQKIKLKLGCLGWVLTQYN